ncbi:MAG: hypothetical protein HYY20_06805 [Candidatus Tectomicrobia bacterium]|uniref:DUF5667 domain-containing protein n=1 Tax=Tectimicrobiota bacterium TaxID=2528274 RepID=A0A932CNC7_UNCTE|nr:hypothetical protein [Candidatus Tectomicrobia bacterium]
MTMLVVLLVLLLLPVAGVAQEAPPTQTPKLPLPGKVVMQCKGMISSIDPVAGDTVSVTLDVEECLVGDCGKQVTFNFSQFILEDRDVYLGSNLLIWKMEDGRVGVGGLGIPRKIREAAKPILDQQKMLFDEASEASRRVSILDGVVKRLKSEGRMDEAEALEQEMKELELKYLYLKKEAMQLYDELVKVGYSRGAPPFREVYDEAIKKKTEELDRWINEKKER